MDFLNRYSLLYFAIGCISYFCRFNWLPLVLLLLILTIFKYHIPTEFIIDGLSINNIILAMGGWWLSYYLDKYTWDD